jgi:hypothetical protein
MSFSENITKTSHDRTARTTRGAIIVMLATTEATPVGQYPHETVPASLLVLGGNITHCTRLTRTFCQELAAAWYPCLYPRT